MQLKYRHYSYVFMTTALCIRVCGIVSKSLILINKVYLCVVNLHCKHCCFSPCPQTSSPWQQHLLYDFTSIMVVCWMISCGCNEIIIPRISHFNLLCHFTILTKFVPFSSNCRIYENYFSICGIYIKYMIWNYSKFTIKLCFYVLA